MILHKQFGVWSSRKHTSSKAFEPVLRLQNFQILDTALLFPVFSIPVIEAILRRFWTWLSTCPLQPSLLGFPLVNHYPIPLVINKIKNPQIQYSNHGLDWATMKWMDMRLSQRQLRHLPRISSKKRSNAQQLHLSNGLRCFLADMHGWSCQLIHHCMPGELQVRAVQNITNRIENVQKFSSIELPSTVHSSPWCEVHDEWTD